MQLITSDQIEEYLGCVDGIGYLNIGDFNIWFGTHIDGRKFVAVENETTANVMIDEIAFHEKTGDEVQIPAQAGRRFQPKLDSNSKASWTLIPAQAGQPKVIT